MSGFFFLIWDNFISSEVPSPIEYTESGLKKLSDCTSLCNTDEQNNVTFYTSVCDTVLQQLTQLSTSSSIKFVRTLACMKIRCHG